MWQFRRQKKKGWNWRAVPMKNGNSKCLWCYWWKAHITFPSHAGALEYCKGFYSLLRMTIVDYDYKLIYVGVGCHGGISEGGLFCYKSFCRVLENVQLNLTDPAPLPRNEDLNWEQDNTSVLLLFVGDDAFHLTTFCMKQYFQKNLLDDQVVFNYRASCCRKIPENGFRILTSRFLLLLWQCHLWVELAEVCKMSSISWSLPS